MPRYDYGGRPGAGDRPTAYTDQWARYDFASPSSVRVAANGGRPAIITSLEFVVAGRGSARTFSAGATNLNTGAFSSSGGVGIGSGGSAGTDVDTFLIGGTGFWAGETNLRVEVHADGSFWYNRNSTGPGSVAVNGGSTMGGSLAGAFTFIQAPAEPTLWWVDPAADGRSARVQINGSGDTGGGAITGWYIQRSTDPGFVGNVVTHDGGDGLITVTGLTPGQSYWWRAAGRNWATNWGGTCGPWSGAVGKGQPLPASRSGKRFDGSSFVAAKAKRFNGSAWVDAKAKRFNGSSWVDLS